jgi:hypothetical protein
LLAMFVGVCLLAMLLFVAMMLHHPLFYHLAFRSGKSGKMVANASKATSRDAKESRSASAGIIKLRCASRSSAIRTFEHQNRSLRSTIN